MVTDQVEQGNLNITHCSTDMVGDFISKGLIGAKFAKTRNKIMGIQN